MSTGKERDAETGNDYFGARYLSSAQQRWTIPDWSAKPSPVPYAKLADPQTLNLYVYVGNNPLVRLDPDGHIIVEDSLKDNKEYQRWKAAYLAHPGAQAQWDKLNDDKSVTVHMAWDKKANKSVTGGYKWTDGKLTEATVTLAAKTGKVENSILSADYPHGSQIKSDPMRQAYVVAHELAHVEFAQSAAGEPLIKLGQALGAIAGTAERALGPRRYENAEWGAAREVNAAAGAIHTKLEHDADQRGWDIVGDQK